MGDIWECDVNDHNFCSFFPFVLSLIYGQNGYLGKVLEVVPFGMLSILLASEVNHRFVAIYHDQPTLLGIPSLTSVGDVIHMMTQQPFFFGVPAVELTPPEKPVPAENSAFCWCLLPDFLGFSKSSAVEPW